MRVSAEERAVPEGWTIDGAERLLRSLAGVVSVRVVAKPGGAVEEIHMLKAIYIRILRDYFNGAPL